MKKILLLFVLLAAASSANATSYYLATAGGGGSDSNNGTSTGTPWLSPNHALNCGDTITAAASSSYVASNFYSWGTVTCGGGNNVAWLQCVTFDACKITVSNANGIAVNSSYWGVQGWEVHASGTDSACFQMRPPNTSTSIHHVIFANDIANGCGSTGFVVFNNGAASNDYVAVIGNIAYDAATNGGECQSGISIYQPKASDTNAGTHIYVAGNFSYANVDANPCAGGTPTDGEGIIFDTWDSSQGGPGPYAQQGVAYNNMLLGNGGRGFEVFNNAAGSSHAAIYAEYNTVWSNNLDTNQNSGGSCGNIRILNALDVTVLYDLSMPTTVNGCGSYSNYSYFVADGNGTVTVNDSWGYSAFGYEEGIQSSSGFSYGAGMMVGTNPSFSNATTPGAPGCGSATSVPNCMATVIANFVPSASGASVYGYQAVSNTSRVDALYPAWLCTVTIPLDLVTPGCGSLTPATISPLNPVLTPSGTQVFTCSANCGTSARWTCATCTGSINSSTGEYTAPSSILANQSVGGYQLLPNDHIFNTNISALPAASNSSTLIAAAGTVPISFDPAFPINYTNGSTPTGTLDFNYTPANNGTFEFPLWPSAGIETGWFDALVGGGNDHHMINVDTTSGDLQELYQPVGLNASCAPCYAASGLKYTNEDYTLPANGATDAAGMFLAPLIVKSQEFVHAVETGGSINHAVRMTLSNGYICNSSTAGACSVGAQQNATGTRHIWPATAEAFSGGGIIPYGTCFRLKSSFNISTFSVAAQVLLTELKNYCMILADGGTGWQLGVDFDNLPATEANALFEIFENNIGPSNFEAVDLSSLEESSMSGAVSTGEAVCYTSSTGTSCTNVDLQGTAQNVNTNQEYFMAGAPQTQLIAYPSSGATWSCTNCTGTILLSVTATGNNYQGTGTTITTATPTPYVTGPVTSTSGDFVDVIVYALSGNPTSVTDVCGNTYTHATAADVKPPETDDFSISHWYSIGITGCSSNVWTATWGSTAEWMGIQAREYNPGGSTITLGTVPTPGTSSSPASFAVTAPFNTSANAVIIAAATTQFGGYSAGPIGAFASGHLLNMVGNGIGSAARFMASEDAALSNAQTGITASMGISSEGLGYGISALVFSGTGGSSVYGTLTSGGLYTAPASLISTTSFPVTITSTANPSVTSQMIVYSTPSAMRFIDAAADYVDSSGNTWFSNGQLGVGLSNSPQLAGCCQTNNSFPAITDYPLWWTHLTSSFNSNDRKLDLHVPSGLYQITYNYGTVEPSTNAAVYFYLQGNLLGGGAINPAAVAGGQALPYTLNVSGQVGANGLLSFYIAGIGGSTGGPGDISSISLKAVQPATPAGLASKGILLGAN